MSQIDTSPAALRALSADAASIPGAEHIADALWEVAAEKDAQQPVAWTLQRELDAKQTTCRAHLWFSNPKSSAWTPLYTAPQNHPERPREMVTPAELDKARQVYLQSDNRLNLEDISAAFESAGVPDESGKQNAPVAPAEVPLPEPDVKVKLESDYFNRGHFYNGTKPTIHQIDVHNAGLAIGDGLFAKEKLRQYAEAYANAKVAAERERIKACLNGIDQSVIDDAGGWWPTSAGAEFGAGVLAAVLDPKKGTL